VRVIFSQSTCACRRSRTERASERDKQKVKTKRALIIFRQWSEREANHSSINASRLSKDAFSSI